MSNQLLFEPRRTRVWLAKAAAVAAMAIATSAVLLAACALLLELAHASQHGIDAHAVTCPRR